MRGREDLHAARLRPVGALRLDLRRPRSMLLHMPKLTSSLRHVHLFRSSGRQFVRIPRGFELPGSEAIMRKEGDRIVIEPALRRSLREVLAGLETIDEALVEPGDPPPRRVDL